MNDKTSLERIESDVRRLAAAPRHGAENPAQHASAAELIAGELRTAGGVVEFQEFEIPGQPSTRRGRNVVGVLSQERPAAPAILIAAHYDTVPGSPGADDNASGVAAMLECARLLGRRSLRQPVVFAAFDAEEKQPPVEGLHGSTAFVEQRVSGTAGIETRPPDHHPISAAIILESIGYSSPPLTQRFPAGFQLLFPRAFDVGRRARFAGDSLAVLSNRRSRALARQFESAASESGLPILPVELPGWMPVPYNLRRSDHAPFWEAGIPAIMVGDTANFRNPNYHLPTDTPETIDYGMISKVVQALTTLIAVTS